MIYKIYLIRHGKTELNKKGLLCGWSDVSVFDEGVLLLKEKIKKYEFLKDGLFFSSDLIRCIETLNILFPNIKKYEKIAELREINFMKKEKFPEKNIDMNLIFNKWISNEYHEFENYSEFIDRIKKGLNKIITKLKSSNKKDAIIVTHGGVIASLRYLYSKKDNKNFIDYSIDNGECVVLIIDNDNIEISDLS